MYIHLFICIVDDLEKEFQFFLLKSYARGRNGFAQLQIYTTEIRPLAYDNASYSRDAYLNMSIRPHEEMFISFVKMSLGFTCMILVCVTVVCGSCKQTCIF